MLPTDKRNMSCLEMLEQCANVRRWAFLRQPHRCGHFVAARQTSSLAQLRLLFSDQGDANSVGYDGIITNPGTDYVYNEAIVFRGPKKSFKRQLATTSSVSTYGLKSKKLDAPDL
jgi:hypothetical protein